MSTYEPSPSAIYEEATEKAKDAYAQVGEIEGLIWEVEEALCDLDLSRSPAYEAATKAQDVAEALRIALADLRMAI